MDTRDLTMISMYGNLISALQSRGFSEEESAEMFIQLTAQAEMEVVEEIIKRMSKQETVVLDGLPEDSSALEIAEKLGVEGEEVDSIRAEKTAGLVQEVIQVLKHTPGK